MAISSVRDLSNHFPKIRKLVEAEGEVLLTEKGRSQISPATSEPPAPVDYWARLSACQPAALSETEAQALHDDNRGDR